MAAARKARAASAGVAARWVFPASASMRANMVANALLHIDSGDANAHRGGWAAPLPGAAAERRANTVQNVCRRDIAASSHIRWKLLRERRDRALAQPGRRGPIFMGAGTPRIQPEASGRRRGQPPAFRPSRTTADASSARRRGGTRVSRAARLSRTSAFFTSAQFQQDLRMSILTGHTSEHAPQRLDANGRAGSCETPMNCGGRWRRWAPNRPTGNCGRRFAVDRAGIQAGAAGLQ